jgi:hypothetical protein
MSDKILIAHRGNIDGPNPERENRWDYVMEALRKGYHVEVDLWAIGEWSKESKRGPKIALGHDGPMDIVDLSFLGNQKLWIHCKNIEAMYLMNRLREKAYPYLNYFFHDQDDVAFTSQGFLWTFPGKLLTNQSIAVLPERAKGWKRLNRAAGICSDFVGNM